VPLIPVAAVAAEKQNKILLVLQTVQMEVRGLLLLLILHK
jgi:hypothetical protein